MNRIIIVVLSLLLALDLQAVVNTGEYYIVNDFFGKLLTANSDNNPRLMDYDSNYDEAFLFVAEASGTSDYVKLKHKSTGLYLTSSTSNNWSVLLSSSGSGDQYLWALDQRFSNTVVNKRNTGARLGCDFNSGDTYYWSSSVDVPIYYNKAAGALNWFTVIPSNGNGYVSSRQVTKTAVFTNEYGVTEQDDYCIAEPVDVNGIDYHIISSTPFEGIGSVNLIGRNSWLVFENNVPSDVISNYLSHVTINGAAAVNGTNCRVEIWLLGAVVIPLTNEAPFVATTDDGFFTVPLGNTSDLGENSNKARSFTLKRGFMATVATGKDGSDYSRVYVADHADLTVTLPAPLDQRISSVYVRNWHYTSKSGYCRTEKLWEGAKALRVSWLWNWDANSSSSADIEYIPIKQHLYWPDDGNFNNSSYTAMMLFNEPEHAEQHTSDKCSCGGKIEAWEAYKQTAKFNATGLRIGSPSATDFTFFRNTDEDGNTVGYLDYCEGMKQRCDFTCTHGYWAPSEWSSKLNTLKSYGRPIWITEWECGASWITSYLPSSTDEYAGKVLTVLDQMEYNIWVERYAYYPDDLGDGKGKNGWMRELFWENNYEKGTAPAGSVYMRVKPHFGYNASVQAVPTWWKPSAVTPVITDVKQSDGKYVLFVTNENGDCTDILQVMRKTTDGTWEAVYSITDRSEFESTSFTIILPDDIKAGDELKVVVTTIFDADTQLESNVFNLYRKLADLQNLEFNEGTFVSNNIRTYAKDIADSETSGLSEVTGWGIASNGDARAGGQFAWGASYFMGASGYTAPASNSEGNSTGGALGINAVWTGTAQYVQNVFLEAGTYSITIPVYNKTGGTTAITKNLFGFIAKDGTEYLNNATTFATDTWTTLTISFVLSEDTYGKLSVGYVAPNTGTANTPHLFVDYFRISYSNEQPSLTALDNLQNLSFNEGTYTNANITIGDSDEQKEVTGWTISSAGGTYHSAGQQAWGSEYTIGPSEGFSTISASDSRGQSDGGALSMVAAWSANVQYTQDVTLPAGSYTLSIPVYNGGGTTAITKNLFGFIADDGTEYLHTANTFTVGNWTSLIVKFTLIAETSGKLSVGYTAAHDKSSNMPKIYVDYVQITRGNRQWPAFSTIGDVNKDGSVTIADVTALVNIIHGWGTTNQYDHMTADLNQDGSVTFADVLELVNMIMTEKTEPF